VIVVGTIELALVVREVGSMPELVDKPVTDAMELKTAREQDKIQAASRAYDVRDPVMLLARLEVKDSRICPLVPLRLSANITKASGVETEKRMTSE